MKTLGNQMSEFRAELGKLGIVSSTENVSMTRVFGYHLNHFKELLHELPDCTHINKNISTLEQHSLHVVEESKCTKVQCIRGIYSDVVVDTRNRDWTLHDGDFFAVQTKAEHRVALQKTTNLRMWPNSISECVLCAQSIEYQYHTCDFIASMNAQCDSGCRTVCVAIFHRFMCKTLDNAYQPSIEIMLLRAYDVISSVLGMLDFACNLMPLLRDTAVREVMNVYSTNEGILRIPVAVDSVSITARIIVDIIKRKYNFEDGVLETLKCLFLNTGYGLLVYTKISCAGKLLVPLSVIPGVMCSCLNNVKITTQLQRNAKMQDLLHDIKSCSLGNIFVSNVQLSLQIKQITEALFISTTQNLCNIEGVVAIARNTLISRDSVKNTIESRLMDVHLDLTDSSAESLVDLLCKIRSVFCMNQDIYFSEILNVDLRKIQSVPQSIFLQLRFLKYCLKHIYNAEHAFTASEDVFHTLTGDEF